VRTVTLTAALTVAVSGDWASTAAAGSTVRVAAAAWQRSVVVVGSCGSSGTGGTATRAAA